MKKQLLILMMLCISTLLNSQTVGDTFVEDSQFFSITSLNPNEVQVFNYIASAGSVVNIPSTVINAGNTYSVTRIHTNAFFDKGLTDVTIPNSVETIGSGAFFTNQLTNVTIPDSVTAIDFGAFLNNPSLISVVSEAIPPPTIITNTTGSDTFSNDRSNIDLIIPAGTSAAYSAAGWTGFNTVTETGGAQVGDTFVDNFITYEVTSLLPNEVETHDYDHVNGPTDVNIPNSVMNSGESFSVTAIGFAAFEWDSGNQLTSVVIPNSVTQIGAVAFAFNQITSANIPDGVTIIEHEIFRENLLTSVTISDNVTFIGFEAFQENAITSVTLGNSIVEIQDDAFATNQIGSISFPSSLTTLGARAFLNNQLTTVTIPSTITTLENSVFRDNLLTSVTIENGVTTIPNDTFRGNLLQNVTIPDSVTTIENGAFEINQLTSVTFGSNVSNIGANSFRYNQLTSVFLPSSVTTLGSRVFLDNPLASVTSANTTPPTIVTGGNNLDSFATNRSGIDLVIPTGTTGPYVTDPGALWTGFNTVTEDASLSTSDFELSNDIKVITIAHHVKVISPDSVILKNYTLFSISGQQIATGKTNEIPTSSFAKGFYILKLDFDKGSVTKKVIVY